MIKDIIVLILNKIGNANQLKLGEWIPKNLNNNEVEIKQTFAGVNYVDIYFLEINQRYYENKRMEPKGKWRRWIIFGGR